MGWLYKCWICFQCLDLNFFYNFVYTLYFSLIILKMTKKKRVILAVIYIIYIILYFLVIKPNRCYEYRYQTFWMPSPCSDEPERGWMACPPDTIKICWFPSLISNLISYDVKWAWQFRWILEPTIILQVLFLCFMILLPIGILSKKWRIIVPTIICIVIFFWYFWVLSNHAYDEWSYQASQPV